MRFACLLALSLALPGLARGQATTISFASGAPVMPRAIETAAATLPVLPAHAGAASALATSGPSDKVAPSVERPEAEHEIIWVRPFTLSSDGQDKGALAYDPVAIRRPGPHPLGGR